jgi:hypothetical protein
MCGEKILSSKELKNKEIVVTRCLKTPCPRFYTDTISETFLILCRDPRHNALQSDKSLSNKSGDSGVVGLEAQNRQSLSKTTRFGGLSYGTSR